MQPEHSLEENKNWVCLAQLGKPFGVQGWMHLHCFCERHLHLHGNLWMGSPSSRLGRTRLTTEPEYDHRYAKIRLAGVSDRNSAALWTHATLWMNSNELEPTSEGVFYWQTLQGCTVFFEAPLKDQATSTTSKRLGVVSHLSEGPGYDYLRVQTEQPFGQSLIWIPFLHDLFILKVDLERREIWVDGERLDLVTPPYSADEPL